MVTRFAYISPPMSTATSSDQDVVLSKLKVPFRQKHFRPAETKQFRFVGQYFGAAGK